jgi:K+-transporting ATPase ATPase C chain
MIDKDLFMNGVLKVIYTSLVATVALAVLLCAAYPLCVWALAQAVFPDQANGSLIVRDGKVVGSSLIGQSFRSPKYFHPRPSATGYDAANSGGTNFGPLAKKLIDAVQTQVADERAKDGLPSNAVVPADAVTASASGLDPHISLANALLQTPGVAKARGMSEDAVRALVFAIREGRLLGFLGEPRVNVLMINVALDDADEHRSK